MIQVTTAEQLKDAPGPGMEVLAAPPDSIDLVLFMWHASVPLSLPM